jgi:3-hydroxyisobutyrate dehydrogenase-like beta-hydroxyacid dehydrogenase
VTQTQPFFITTDQQMTVALMRQVGHYRFAAFEDAQVLESRRRRGKETAMSQSTSEESIGFIGLGNLGGPIAANLLASGKSLAVWNRTASKADALVARGARLASSPAAAIARGGVVFTILWDDTSLAEMVTAEFLEALGPGGVHVSMTTVTPEMARKMAALHQRHGSIYVEAPIFGIPAQAMARKLTLCLAGPAAAKGRVRPLLEAMGGERIVDFGEAIGTGTATKLVGNFMIISGFVALQEAFNVLVAGGIDPKPVLEMITTTFAATPGNQRYAGYLLSGNPLPTSGIPLKDVDLFEQFAATARTQTPLASRMHEILKR